MGYRLVMETTLTTRPQQEKLTVRRILEATAKHFQLSTDQVLTGGRARKFSTPRQIVMYLARQRTEQSLPAIANRPGLSDHNAVWHGSRSITARLNPSDENNYNLQIDTDVRAIEAVLDVS